MNLRKWLMVGLCAAVGAGAGMGAAACGDDDERGGVEVQGGTGTSTTGTSTTGTSTTGTEATTSTTP